jgi:hypothetical protein
VHGDICVDHVKGLERHAMSDYGHYCKWRAELDCIAIAAAAKKCELPMAGELSKCVLHTHNTKTAVENAQEHNDKANQSEAKAKQAGADECRAPVVVSSVAQSVACCCLVRGSSCRERASLS